MTTSMRHKRLFYRRGFNLIEVAIVLVVLGLLGSAILVPFGAILVEEQFARERAAVERARQAVIGYAARSATPGAVINLNGNTDTANTFTVPAGRAYFPCPDIDGDGHEDRNFYDNTGTIIRVAGAMPAVNVAANGVVTFQRFNDDANNNAGDLKTVGSCSVMRGFLPWRTLGLPPQDTWGNLRTYAVDAAYSHSIVGFNQNSIADEFVTHDLLRPNLNYERRLPIEAEDADTMNSLINSNRPIGLCLGVAALCNSTNPAAIANLMLAYGDRTGGLPGGASIAHRDYTANDLQNGLIFVIVSHGRNGFGAGRYNPGAAIACNPGIADATNHENANYPFVDNPFNPAADLGNANCRAQDIASRTAQFFTTLRRNNEGDLAFDDVMTWATREQINNAITRASPDLPLYYQ